MVIHLDIPDTVMSGVRLPEPEMEARLRTELAVALYAQELLSFGKASELAGLNRFAFSGLISSRNIARHYDTEDLAQDLAYARGQ